MTQEELSKLTPEEKRIRIAKAHGWKTGACSGFVWVAKEDRYYESRTQSADELLLASTPDYLNSRDACAEFEGSLNDEQKIKYIWNLGVGDTVYTPDSAVFEIATSSAADRSDAFLLTVC